jgi:hypothetical protein
LGNGNGSFTVQAVAYLAAVGQSWSLASGDFNGDGKLDLAVIPTLGGETVTSVAILTNTTP